MTDDDSPGRILWAAKAWRGADKYYASPVAGDGKVYMISRNGSVSVLEAAAQWKIASSGEMGEEVYATPAIADGHIWVRTATALYDFAETSGRKAHLKPKVPIKC